MNDMKVIIIRQASEMGMLYGSVSARDVADALKEAGKPADRSMIQIDTPIKTLGLFPVKVKLHPEVTIKITVNVARSPEEAITQAEKGMAILRAEEKAAKEEAERAMIESIGVPSNEAQMVAEAEAAKEEKAK